MQATFSFTLSDNIAAMQVETFCSAYYQLCDQLVPRQNVVFQVEATCSKSRLEFYFLPQILVLLLVLPMKLQSASQ